MTSLRASFVPAAAQQSPTSSRHLPVQRGDDDTDAASSSTENLLGGPESSSYAAAAHGGDAVAGSRIVVAVRKRPFRRGVETGETDAIAVNESNGVVSVNARRTSLDNLRVIDQTINFAFDYTFDENASNALLYVQTARPLLEHVRKGQDAVVFAFGQTGSGKTHTMLGSASGEHGLCALASRDMLSTFKGMKMSVSFYEIYGQKVFDLLNDRAKVKMLEDENKRINLLGLTEQPLLDHAMLLQLMTRGLELRAQGETHANDRSSRSHAVLVFNIRTRRDPGIFSRMIFIDLAGSERAADTTNLDKTTRAEGAEINKSLLALKECVRAMAKGKKHVPFRGSKLTQVLRDSFMGNCATCMIANISPCARHLEDTVNTLRYADRIKELRPLDGDNGQGRSVEPDLCPKCGFPFFIDNPSTHVCPKTYVSCPHCRREVVRNNLEAHLETCIDAPAPCVYCARTFKRSDLPQHHASCPKATIACHHCGANVVRERLAHHVSNLCPSVKVQCRLCRENYARSRIQDHEDKECPMRQVTCPSCGFLMRFNKFLSHSVTCGSRGRRESYMGGVGSSQQQQHHGVNNTSLTSLQGAAPLVPPSNSSLANNITGSGSNFVPLTSRRAKPSLAGIKVPIMVVDRLPSLSSRLSRRSTPGSGAFGGEHNAATAEPETPQRRAKRKDKGDKATPTKAAAAAVAEGRGLFLAGGGGAGTALSGVAPPPQEEEYALTAREKSTKLSDISPPLVTHATGSSVLQQPSSSALSLTPQKPPPAAAAGAPQPKPPSRSGLTSPGHHRPPSTPQRRRSSGHAAASHICPFAFQGCSFAAGSEFAMQDHLSKSVTLHLSLMQQHADALGRENSRLRKRLAQLEPTPPSSGPAAGQEQQPQAATSAAAVESEGTAPVGAADSLLIPVVTSSTTNAVVSSSASNVVVTAAAAPLTAETPTKPPAATARAPRPMPPAVTILTERSSTRRQTGGTGGADVTKSPMAGGKTPRK